MQVARSKEKNKESGWFALHTRHQHENKVAMALECKGIEAFLPTYKCTKRWNDRMKVLCAPLFPGQVLATNFEGRILEVLNTPGIAAIVSVGGVPAEIPRGEIEVIRRTIKPQSNIEPHESLRSGDAVRLEYLAAESYSGPGDLELNKARQSRGNAATQKARWTQARVWYLKSMPAWRRVDHRLPVAPSGFDAGDPARVETKLQLCEAALANLGAPPQ